MRIRRTQWRDSPKPVPEGVLVTAIGDVHGCADHLETMYRALARDVEELEPGQTTCILLGDLIDRGPRSFECLMMAADGLASLAPDRQVRDVALVGNHDDWLVRAVAGTLTRHDAMLWVRNGGIATWQDMGIGNPGTVEVLMRELRARLPDPVLDLLAGMVPVYRIGELVLNPYVGPRFKSGVITTNMPLLPDKPIDFGLQDFCEKCTKCARECPCQAIPYGDKIMFNGYEMWKPDIERCVSYRLTNHKGSMCGRCMKMCPLNKIPSVDGPLVHRIGTWLGVNARWLKPILVPIAVYFDDRLGYGKRNPNKKWWVDMELVDGAGASAAGLSLGTSLTTTTSPPFLLR